MQCGELCIEAEERWRCNILHWSEGKEGGRSRLGSKVTAGGLQSLGRARGGRRWGAVGWGELQLEGNWTGGYNSVSSPPPLHPSLLPPSLPHPQLSIIVWHMYLPPSVLHNQIAPLLGPSQDVDFLPGLQDTRTRVRELTLHDPPLGKPYFVVSNDGVVTHGESLLVLWV